MTSLDPRKTIEQLVQENPQLLPVLEKLGVNYEFAWNLTLEDISFVHQFDIQDVARQLESGVREAMLVDEKALLNYDIPQLIGYILFTHHAFLETELPRLQGLLHQAIQTDGPSNPELVGLLSPFKKFREALEWHMREEEKQLFPFLLILVSDEESPAMNPESLQTLTRLFEYEDDEIRQDLELLKQKTRGYHVPEDAGQAFHDLFHDLDRLEGELNRHMRVENGILFPKVIAAENRLRERQAARELTGRSHPKP